MTKSYAKNFNRLNSQAIQPLAAHTASWQDVDGLMIRCHCAAVARNG